MPIQFIPALSYVLISSFTPGPATISTTSVALMHGYKKTLVFQCGLTLGVFIFMLTSGLISNTLLQLFPAVEPILRYIGALYILYLAFVIARAHYSFDKPTANRFGFFSGILLNLLNPKLLVYSFTLFSTFLAPLTENFFLLVLAAVILAFISFAATSTWALFGSTIKTYLKTPRITLVVNIILALSLVYTGIALAGFI